MFYTVAAAAQEKGQYGKETFKEHLPCVKTLLRTFHYFTYSLQHFC